VFSQELIVDLYRWVLVAFATTYFYQGASNFTVGKREVLTSEAKNLGALGFAAGGFTLVFLFTSYCGSLSKYHILIYVFAPLSFYFYLRCMRPFAGKQERVFVIMERATIGIVLYPLFFFFLQSYTGELLIWDRGADIDYFSPINRAYFGRESLEANRYSAPYMVMASLASFATFFILLRNYSKGVYSDRWVAFGVLFSVFGLLTDLFTSAFVPKYQPFLFSCTGFLPELLRVTYMAKQKINKDAIRGDFLEQNLTLLKDRQPSLVNKTRQATIGRLGSTFSHEINNPLGLSKGYLEMISGAWEESKKGPTSELFEKMSFCLEKIEAFVKRFSRISDDGSEVVPARFNLEEMLLNFASIYSREQCRINFQSFMEKDLEVYSDPYALTRVLLLLVDNSYEFNPFVNVRITIVALINDDQLKIVYGDNGCGIPESDLTKVFEPFYTTKPVVIGAGVGLAVAESIMVSLGGEIRAVESDEGASFVLEFPAGLQSSLQAVPS
jgi:signal transduction histidine kinase